MTNADESQYPAATFIHDLSSPVAVALGMVDLVLDDATTGNAPLNPAQQKRIEKAQAALVKIQALISKRRKAIQSKLE